MLKTASRLLILTVGISALTCATACGTKAPRVVMVKPVVYDDRGNPSDLVKLGPDPITVYVFVDGEWVLSRNKVTIEGWLAAPPPPQKKDDQ